MIMGPEQPRLIACGPAFLVWARSLPRARKGGMDQGARMTDVTMKNLLEAGVHFGHQTSRWNPKMKPYIFGARNGIYIVDLQKTVRLAREAFKFVSDVCSRGGSVLFVGTKKQAQDAVVEEA